MGWLIGAVLSILGSVSSNLGVNVQKYSFIRQAQRDPAHRTTHWKDAYWLTGLGLVIFGSLGDFAALSMVAQSIVAPLASTTLVTNVIFAHFWLHEAIGRRELVGTSLIIIGSTLAVVFGDHSENHYTNDQLVRLIGGGWFLAYAVLVVVLCVAGLALHRKITPIKKNLVDAIRRYEVAVEANNAQGADWEDEVIARLEFEYKRWEKLHPFALCALSGAFGAQSVLFGKVFAELLSSTWEGDNQLFNFFPWVALICMGVTVASQLHFLAIALSYFDALYAVPVFQCFFIGVSTLGGALYFREVYDFTVGEGFAFVIGLLLTLAGVAVLSTRKMSQRNIVHRVAQQESQSLVGISVSGSSSSNLLQDTIIPEGDEDRGDVGLTDSALLVKRSPGMSVLLPRPSPQALANAALDAERERTRGQEFEMSDIGARRGSLPTMKTSAQVELGFAEKVERDQQEILDLQTTVGDAREDLTAKLAAAGYGAGAPAAAAAEKDKDVPEALLHPSPNGAKAYTPAMAIQIEADQDYINRQDDRSGISQAPMSAAARKYKQTLAARHDADLDILNLQGGLSDGSPMAASSGSGVRSGSFDLAGRAETPRSMYVQERERASSGTSSGRNSPDRSGASTPRRIISAILGESDSPGNSEPNSPAMHGRHMRQMSSTMLGGGTAAVAVPVASGAGGALTPKVRPVPSSAMFSGAFLESAQELPDLESDTRLQRLTRLSTVGHWVAGLHAQMPVAGGVVQAILQAKEMQSLLDDEDAKVAKLKEGQHDAAKEATGSDSESKKSNEEARIDMPVAEPAIAGAIELAERKPGSAKTTPAKEDETTADTAAAATAASSNPSTSASSAAATTSSATTAGAAPAAAPALSVEPSLHPHPVARVIEFSDDYDPFSTQGATKLHHRDPFANSSSPEIASPTSAFASLKPKPKVAEPASPSAVASAEIVHVVTDSESAAELARLEEHARQRAAEKVLFSPLSVTTKHPLQPGAMASPPPVASPIDTQPIQSSSTTTSPLPPSAHPQPPLHTFSSISPIPPSYSATPIGPSPVPVDPNASVDEWAAALRIQSLYRGRVIRRALRESGQLTAQQLRDLHTAVYDDSETTNLTAVDPILPEAAADPEEEDEEDAGESGGLLAVGAKTASLHPPEIEQDWQQLDAAHAHTEPHAEMEAKHADEELNLM